MTTNLDIKGIYNLAILILYIIRVDFARNTKNIFFRNIRKAIFKHLGHFNNIYIKKYEYKIVIESSLSNISIVC